MGVFHTSLCCRCKGRGGSEYTEDSALGSTKFQATRKSVMERARTRLIHQYKRFPVEIMGANTTLT